MGLQRAHTLVDLIVSLPGPGVVAEIGVFRGETSEYVLKTCENVTLHMVDPWEAIDKETAYYKSSDPCARHPQESFDKFYEEALKRTRPYMDRRHIHRCRSETLPHRATFPRKLDGAFIDAAHDYNSVVHDMNIVWPMINKGGFMAGHDYQRNGRIPHIRGVKKAVDEFARLRALTIGTGPGMVWWFWKD